MIEKIAQMRDGLAGFFGRLETMVDTLAEKAQPVVERIEHGVLRTDAWLRRLPAALSEMQMKVVEKWEGSQTRATLENLKRVLTHPEEIDWEGVKEKALNILTNPNNVRLIVPPLLAAGGIGSVYFINLWKDYGGDTTTFLSLIIFRLNMIRIRLIHNIINEIGISTKIALNDKNRLIKKIELLQTNKLHIMSADQLNEYDKLEGSLGVLLIELVINFYEQIQKETKKSKIQFISYSIQPEQESEQLLNVDLLTPMMWWEFAKIKWENWAKETQKLKIDPPSLIDFEIFYWAINKEYSLLSNDEHLYEIFYFLLYFDLIAPIEKRRFIINSDYIKRDLWKKKFVIDTNIVSDVLRIEFYQKIRGKIKLVQLKELNIADDKGLLYFQKILNIYNVSPRYCGSFLIFWQALKVSDTLLLVLDEVLMEFLNWKTKGDLPKTVAEFKKHLEIRIGYKNRMISKVGRNKENFWHIEDQRLIVHKKYCEILVEKKIIDAQNLKNLKKNKKGDVLIGNWEI